MLKFHSAVTTGAAALLLFPALQASTGDLTVLRGALDEIQRALQVLNTLEPRIAAGEPGSSALVRSVTEPPLADPQAADRDLERLRNEVNLLQVELDVAESGPLPVGPPSPDPWEASAGGGEAPPISTGLSADQRALLEQDIVGPVLPQAAPPSRPATTLRVPLKPEGAKTALPAADAGYSADPMRHAEACLRAGRHKEGFALIAARTDPPAVYLQARLLERLGRLDEAIEALASVVDKLAGSSEGRRAQSDLEFFRWKRDFLKRMPSDTAGKAEGQ
jgi:hypothetical protein